nr:hypothetical protein [Tanacetum cinerariifolium]
MVTIDRQLPFEYTITSRSNDVVVFEKSSPYDMIKELKSIFEKQAGVERFDLTQTFHACKQKEGKPVAAYVLQMKRYVDQLEPKDDTCHHCKEEGHWKRNCPVYLVELLRERSKLALPVLQISKEGEIRSTLFVRGNGVRTQVEAIGSYDLFLPNGLVIILDNCHYAPSITRGVISVHRLVENRFVQCFMDFGISVSKNNVHYFNVILSNGIYEIHMHDLVPNVNSIYDVSTKRAKHNLDSTNLWHCRLAHISKNHIENLQQEGLLRSTYESFDQCVSCLLGKMIRKLFPHHLERVTDLLGIIHTDMCVNNEVENQLRKTIRALRSDQGGEYISQEIKDYLKACGIVQQLTHPYTPQHNCVSERRNHTLLDMVRSMMNLTTLSLSFWDYALESATRILNMVPTKKVNKTPYELWYAEFFEKNLITQEVSGRAVDLKEIQDEDTSPSEITSKIPMEVKGFKPPQEEVILICRSERTH